MADLIDGECWSCKRSMRFDPEGVPRIVIDERGVPRIDGAGHRIRAPICGDCMETVNAVRKHRGLKQIPVPDGAYGPDD